MGLKPITYDLEGHCSILLSYKGKRASAVFTDGRSKNNV